MPQIIKESFQAILELKFADIPYEIEGVRAPEKRDIRGVIEFFNQTKDSATGYTIHCHAGISRSTAVALGIAYLITGDERAAADMFRAAVGKKSISPNIRIVQFFDELLGSNLKSIAHEFHRATDDAMKKELLDLFEPKGLLAKADSVRSKHIYSGLDKKGAQSEL